MQVVLASRDDGWRLRMTNTSPGIPPEVATQLFTRFYRGEHTSNVTGNGLGLSLSLELARAHGGDLEFAGTHQVLTTFVWKIPLAERTVGAGTPPVKA